MRAKEFIFESAEYEAHARQMAEKYGVPYSIVRHAMSKETGHISDPNKRASAVSKRGAGGVMQLMPATAKHLGVKDRFDPYQNIEGGTKYLAQLYQKYNDPALALAAYNAGPGNVKKYGGVPPFKETQRYVQGYAPDPEPTKLAQAPKPEPTIGQKVKTFATDVLSGLVGAKAAGAEELPQQQTQPQNNYTIQKGQTLSGIAKEKGVSVQDMMSANPQIKDPNKIQAGATINTNLGN
jgi:hypothetical protein